MVKNFKSPVSWWESLKIMIVLVFSAITGAISFNFFFIPTNVYASGLNGFAQLFTGITSEYLNIQLETGLIILLLNIPIAILGWFKIGKTFTLLSFLSSFLVSILMVVLPVVQLTPDPIMSALFGGVIGGAGVGFALKYGFSTGGMDIIAMVLAKTTGRTIGNLMMVMNAIIAITAGATFGWEYSFYTILSIYAFTKVVDTIHTSHQKVTAMIVTTDPDTLVEAIHKELVRGVTVLPATGGYSKTNRAVLMIVVSRYEIYSLEQAVKEADAAAFVNFMQTNKVMGEFLNSEQQKERRASSVF